MTIVNRSLQIALDVTRLVSLQLEQRHATGVDRVLQAYVREFGAQARAVVRWQGRYFVLNHPCSQWLFTLLLNEHRPQLRWFALIRAVINSWRQRDIRGYWLINAGHSGLEHHRFAAEMQRLGVKPLVLLHDLIPITHPEYNRIGECERHHIRVKHACQFAAGIFTVSAMTAQVLARYADAQRWSLPPVLVTPLGVTPSLTGATANITDDAYFVVVSTIEARKNHLLLLQIWRDWVDSGRSQIPKLILIGKRGWEAEQTFDLLDRCRQLKDVVIEVQDCSDAELLKWLSGARALLFPSFTEGFGLPVLEAMQQGVPVIASDLAVFREFAGDIPEYLSVSHSAAWASAISDYCDSAHPRRLAQLQRLQGYTPPQWSEHFALVRTWIAQHNEPA
jgi:glycosyltransferase involved in cell wall biosynthesis